MRIRALEARITAVKSARVLAICLLAVSICAGNAQNASVESWRSADEKTQAEAVSLARKAFDAYVSTRSTIDPPTTLAGPFKRRCGVFVSAMRHGAPRCCMGSLYPTEPDTAREIIASAVAAAGRDRRFPPIKPAELRGLTLIVSIVSSPHPIDPQAIAGLDPARDGIAVKYGDRYGVTLSGETDSTDRMLKWARARAGAGAASPVQLFRLEDVRFIEKPQ